MGDALNSQKIAETSILPLPHNEKAIPVIFSTDANYYLYLGVTIQSIIKNKKPDTKYDIIILEMELDEYQKNKLQELACDNVSIRIINVKNLVKKYQLNNLMTINHLSESAYYRLLIEEILIEYKKIIYLDCDLIVLDDLSEIYDTNLDDYYAGAIKDYIVSQTFAKDKDFIQYCKDVLNIENLDLYFNSGVLVLNLDLMRKNNTQEKMLKTALFNNKYFHDQNVLNSVFNGKVAFLDGRYNVLYHLLFSRKKHLYSEKIWDKYIEELKNAKIMHYAGSAKPWERPDLPNAYLWWKYARLTPFYEEILYTNVAPKEYFKYWGSPEKLYTNFWQRIFSIRIDNSNPSKSFKVITIFGFKFKAQRKR